MTRFDESILVVAHPDDEALWFSSILGSVREVIICYTDLPGSDLGAARRRVASRFPLDTVSWLDLPEPGSFSWADWSETHGSRHGLVVRPRFAAAYLESFERLLAALEPRLAGCGSVVTHNPWGEYGHEDHAQLSRVVETAGQRFGYEAWCSNYCGPRALRLAEEALPQVEGDYLRLPTNKQLAHELRQIYLEEQCWTYSASYQWFDDECFLRIPSLPPGPPVRGGSDLPLNLLRDADLPTRMPRDERPARR